MEDYQKRLVEEYKQLKERYLKLHKMLVRYDAGTLKWSPAYPVDLLRQQKAAMGTYLNILEIRAEAEHIPLPIVIIHEDGKVDTLERLKI